MVDNVQSQSPDGAPGGPRPKSGAAAFLSSSTGRLVVGGTALFLVVVAIGALAFFFLLKTGADVAPTTTTTRPVSQTTTLSAPPSNPPEAPLKDTFTFRNVFAPTVHPARPAPTGSGATPIDGSNETTGTGGTGGAIDALVLQSIVTDSGERVATFTWRGTTYEAREGDAIGTSPWKVLEIYSDSVLLLFGDSRVTLSVGQGYASNNNSISK